MTDWNAYLEEARSALQAATSVAELDEPRVRYLGRRSELKQALRNVRDRETGQTLNALRDRLEALVGERERALAEEARARLDETLDVTLPGERPSRGHLHPLTQIIREVE
ncbi:MAG: phenylalanine--tRNA ligase subunit alpha, partial [Actinomycetota bacterium]|nr:phenylalanine--tRNA ligase subunit alpha [Actinomycetota bacterium]